MNPHRETPSRRTRRHGQTPYGRNSRQASRQRNENGGSGSNNTPSILQALLPMFRMQRQLLELSRNFCQRMRDKLERAEHSQKLEVAQSKPGKWTYRLPLVGVLPEYIHVKINSDNLVVSNTKSGCDMKTINLPYNVKSSEVQILTSDDDAIVFEAPYKACEYSNYGSQTESASQVQNPPYSDPVQIPIEPFIEHLENDSEEICTSQIAKEIEDGTLKDKLKINTPKSQEDGLEFSDKKDASNPEKKTSETGCIPKHSTGTDAHQFSPRHKLKSSTFKRDFKLPKFPTTVEFVNVMGHTLIIKADEDKTHDGLDCSESFQRRYKLPDNVDMQQLRCMRKSDGSLHVRAPYLDSVSDAKHSTCTSIQTGH